jgi:hypothetical protein
LGWVGNLAFAEYWIYRHKRKPPYKKRSSQLL